MNNKPKEQTLYIYTDNKYGGQFYKQIRILGDEISFEEDVDISYVTVEAAIEKLSKYPKEARLEISLEYAWGDNIILVRVNGFRPMTGTQESNLPRWRQEDKEIRAGLQEQQETYERNQYELLRKKFEK